MTLTGPVLVVGTGLLGTSVGLACRRAGLDVLLSDTATEHLRTATGLGAGRPATGEERPQLVVVAVPPDHLGPTLLAQLAATDAIVTDVGSVKTGPLAAVERAATPDQLARYVGGHPMAGSERSGPLAAVAGLFDGRPWAVTPHPAARDDATEVVWELALACGAVPVRLSPEEHDRAVARTSHLPQLVSALVAGRLTAAPPEHLVLSGQGVRDVTRIAGSDPALWQQIIDANAEAVLDVLAEVRADLDSLMTAVSTGERDALGELLARGVAGTRAIPGKHGGPARPTTSVLVAVPDHPGELARLFADAGDSGVNIEDVRIDHDPGRAMGLVELVVEEQRAEHLRASLESRDWETHR
ncbi:MAG: prephenate dehydrogenase [Nocardioidaceae bacterium]